MYDDKQYLLKYYFLYDTVGCYVRRSVLPRSGRHGRGGCYRLLQEAQKTALLRNQPLGAQASSEQTAQEVEGKLLR